MSRPDINPESVGADAARAGVSGEVISVDHIPKGSNTSFRVETDSGRYVVKYNTFSTYSTFRAEYALLHFLYRGSDIPSPVPIGRSSGMEGDTRHACFVMEELPGQPATPLTEEYNPELVRQLGALIRDFADAGVGEFEGYGRIRDRISAESEDSLEAGDPSWREYYSGYVDRVVGQAAGISRDDLVARGDDLRDALAEVINAVPAQPRTELVHPDMRLENILVDESGTATIVGAFDFERVDSGDSLYTLVNTHYLLSRGLDEETSARVRADLRDGYGDWPGAELERAYRIGAIAKEVRGFENWWGDLPEEDYQSHLTRVKNAVTEIVNESRTP